MRQIIKLTEQDINNIVKNAVNKILKEDRNYKNRLNKIRAASHAYGHGDKANGMIDKMLAKSAAIQDINADRAVSKNRIYKTNYNGDFDGMDRDSFEKWDDYHRKSNNDFLDVIKYNDLDVVPEEGEDMLTVDY